MMGTIDESLMEKRLKDISNTLEKEQQLRPSDVRFLISMLKQQAIVNMELREIIYNLEKKYEAR